MLQERLLRHTLGFTTAARVLFSTDYPFHQPGAADRLRIASGNAEALFRLA